MSEARLRNVCPRARKLLLQLEEVVDLAVGDDVHRAGLVGDRLLAGGDVDDRQAPHAERDAGPVHHPVAVGPAVGERPDHASELRLGDRRAQVAIDDAGDAAHD